VPVNSFFLFHHPCTISRGEGDLHNIFVPNLAPPFMFAEPSMDVNNPLIGNDIMVCGGHFVPFHHTICEREFKTVSAGMET